MPKSLSKAHLLALHMGCSTKHTHLVNQGEYSCLQSSCLCLLMHRWTGTRNPWDWQSPGE